MLTRRLILGRSLPARKIRVTNARHLKIIISNLAGSALTGNLRSSRNGRGQPALHKSARRQMAPRSIIYENALNARRIPSALYSVYLYFCLCFSSKNKPVARERGIKMFVSLFLYIRVSYLVCYIREYSACIIIRHCSSVRLTDYSRCVSLHYTYLDNTRVSLLKRALAYSTINEYVRSSKADKKFRELKPDFRGGRVISPPVPPPLCSFGRERLHAHCFRILNSCML